MTAPRDEIVSTLERGDRVVTLVAPPGAGRSTLAQLVAERWAAKVGPAVVADLALARDATQIGDAIARALDAWPCDGDGPSDPLLAAAQCLASRGPLLLVLDGFDDLSAFALVTVMRWGELAPSLQQLVFCREPLRITDEVVVELGAPLAEAAQAPTPSAPRGDRMRPRVRTEKSLAEARASGDARAIGEWTWFAALVDHRAGALDAAEAGYADAERAAERAGQTWIAACARIGRGLVELERGQLAEARTTLGRAEATIAVFDPRMEGILLALLGATKARLGELVDAGWLLERAERLLQSVDVALLPAVAGPLRGLLDLERAARARASGDASSADALERRARERLQSAMAAGDPDTHLGGAESLATTVWGVVIRMLGSMLHPPRQH